MRDRVVEVMLGTAAAGTSANGAGPGSWGCHMADRPGYALLMYLHPALRYCACVGRCYRAEGLTFEEVKDCVKCASLNLEYIMPAHASEAKTIAQTLEEAVAALVSNSISAATCRCGLNKQRQHSPQHLSAALAEFMSAITVSA